MIHHGGVDMAHDVNASGDDEPLEQVDDFRREQQPTMGRTIKPEKNHILDTSGRSIE